MTEPPPRDRRPAEASVPALQVTEKPNPSTTDLDLLETKDVLRRINDLDRRVPWAVETEIETIALAVDGIADRLSNGGSLHLFGAGTSGRLCVLEAAEMPPTFSTPPRLVRAHIAGGLPALTTAVEAAEDDFQAGQAEALDAIGERDAAIGVSASGSACYVLGALEAARQRGALSVAIVNNPESPLAVSPDIAIVLRTGAEALAGSTRMKAATAQKLTLNMISTAVMVKLGKVYSNLMVDLRPTNAKLRARAERLVQKLTGSDDRQAREALEASEYRVKTAAVMLARGCSKAEAERLLHAAGGRLRSVLHPGAGGSGDAGT